MFSFSAVPLSSVSTCTNKERNYDSSFKLFGVEYDIENFAGRNSGLKILINRL